MPVYRNNSGTAEKVDVRYNDNGTVRNCKVYENQSGTAVLVYSPTVLDDVTYVLEEWDPANFGQWGDVTGPDLVTTQAFSKDYSMRGTAGDGNQRIHDNERDHNNLPRYMVRGDNMRVMIYHPSSYTNMNSGTRYRWAYGGPYEESAYYVMADLYNDAFHIVDSNGHTTLGSTYGYNYPGGEWWAMEIEWRNPTHTARLVNYSDPDNPVTEASLQVDDTTHDDSSPLGHSWFVWNDDTSGHMYTDYAVFYE